MSSRDLRDELEHWYVERAGLEGARIADIAPVATGVVAATPAEPEVLTERKPKEEAADDKEKDPKKK